MNTALDSNKFAWLLKREFWEYRGGFFMAPLITTLVMLAIVMLALISAEFTAHQHGIQLGGMNIDQVIAHVGEGDYTKVHSAIDIGLMGMSAPIGIVFCFVVFFYLLGALYNDRADRSVLFWKSLPLSDTETVLAKVATAMFVAPVLAVGAMIVLHLGFLILLGLVCQLHVRVDIDEHDIPRFRKGAPARAVVRGNPAQHFPLEFVRIEPFVVPKRHLTGDDTERVDTRVLQVIYALPLDLEDVFVGQPLDVYIDAANREDAERDS